MNQRDQAHAYRFLARRLSSALVRDDPDGPDAPMRRLAIASFGSVMIGALVVAGVGVFGVLRPGGATAWKNGQAMILEKETGSRYLYLGGELHPVLNYASARLVLGQSAFAIVSVSRASLSAAPVGAPIGIQGAPDELPTAATLATGPWSVCSRPALDQSGTPTAIAALSIGRPATGSPLGVGHGLLVSSADGHLYLVWNGLRHLIPGGQAALAALSYTGSAPVVVADAWLSVMPEGTDLATPTLAGRLGSRGPVVAGTPSRIGQVFKATGTSSYYVAEQGGLAPLSTTGALLALADPAIRALYRAGQSKAISVTAGAIAVAGILGDASPSDQPRHPPPLLSLPGGQGDVCVVYPAGPNSSPQVRTLPVTPSAIGTWTRPRLYDRLGFPLADQVRLPAGDGAVAQDASGLGAGTVYLITNQGVKYALTSSDLLASLGLAGVHPARVPDVLLELLRSGPTLDRAAAERTVAP